jgi:hypothetical protein
MMKKGFFLLALLCGGFLLGCPQQSSTILEPLEDTENIKQTASFQDHQENRIVVFVFVADTPAPDIRDHAEGLSYTQDRLLAVYYFVEGSRSIDPIALRRSHTIMNANELFFTTPELAPWHFVFMRPFVGEARFSDCRETPDDILCRKD